ncbi:type II secretion system protein [Sporomusa sp. KB1]|jgi:type II secretion system protein G|uniref:type II secretion system protein n=1 Tax=Sporomusa sp. KB1 TaxID=943346 RepID=UPI0011ADF8CD|nr:prepilin-type N-terminal cleavage/methylation domain-containing protein [Sporomusa sp. KB1]TWH48298.1 general secretion pathway protein G [Sporomusa sp. KB1]
MKSQKGFTLIELMVVIAIIGILTAIAVPKFGSAADSANKAKIQADLRTLDSAISMYYAKEGKYPDTLLKLAPDFIVAVPSVPSPYKGSSGLTYKLDNEGTSPTYRAYIEIATGTKIFADTTTPAW